MASLRLLMFPLVIGTVCTVPSALRTKRVNDFEARVTSYTFNAFIEDFGRTYTVGSAEYLQRSAVFEASLAQIFAKNAREDQLWTAGMHPFMDLTDDERQQLHGYKPSGSRKSGIIALEMNTTVYGGSGDSFEAPTPPVLNQGSLCGSCWAVSAVQAVEAQLMKTDNPTRENQYGSPMRLSTQAVLECAQIENPHNCGGPGGCKGATSEVAFDYMRDHGIPLSSDHPYHPNPTHLSKKCPLEPYPANWARVTIDNWKSLPSNKAQSLMQAIVEDGAVVVAIDSHNLYPYSSGIFDDCPKDAVVSHALLAKGYGEAGGKKYWSLQNSWGLRWGEAGSVRVLRRDNEDQWCGTDNHPEEGFACDGDTKPVTVCGTCGILFDMVIPSSPQVQAPQQTGSDPSSPLTQPDSDTPGPDVGAHVVDQNHEFTTWGMLPPSTVDVVSANRQVDGYLSTPAPDTSVSSNQVRATAPPVSNVLSALPDASPEVADQELVEQNGAIAQSSNIFMPAPQAVLAPSSAPTEAQPSSVPVPTTRSVVVPSSARTGVFAPKDVEAMSAVHDTSAVNEVPTSDMAKMQQLLKHHEPVPDAVNAPPALEPVKADVPTSDYAKMQQLLKQHEPLPEVADAPPAEEPVEAGDVPPAEQVFAAKSKQPAVDAQAVQSDSTMEKLWDELPESKPAADANSAVPVVASEAPQTLADVASADQQASSDLKMPAPITFSDSVDQFNSQSKSFDSVNAAVDVGSVTPVPVAEVPPPESPRSETQPLEEASFDVPSSSTAALGDIGSKVTVLNSNDDVAAKPPTDLTSTDAMKNIFSDYKFA